MSKRARGQSTGPLGGSPPGAPECPVCFETMTRRGPLTQTRPFQCGHSICKTCDARMVQTDDRRCPTCRTARIGMSQADAEPLPDRNHDLPSMEGVMEGIPEDLQSFVQAFGSQSLAAGRYGLPPGARFRRPNTGHIMHFPIQPPGAWGELDHERIVFNAPGDAEAANSNAIPHDLLQGMEDIERVRAALTTSVPHHLVDALLNLPDTPTMHEWEALRHAPPALPPVQPQTHQPARRPPRRGGRSR